MLVRPIVLHPGFKILMHPAMELIREERDLSQDGQVGHQIGVPASRAVFEEHPVFTPMIFILYGPMIPALALPECVGAGFGLTASDVISILPFRRGVMQRMYPDQGACPRKITAHGLGGLHRHFAFPDPPVLP